MPMLATHSAGQHSRVPLYCQVYADELVDECIAPFLLMGHMDEVRRHCHHRSRDNASRVLRMLMSDGVAWQLLSAWHA